MVVPQQQPSNTLSPEAALLRRPSCERRKSTLSANGFFIDYSCTRRRSTAMLQQRDHFGGPTGAGAGYRGIRGGSVCVGRLDPMMSQPGSPLHSNQADRSMLLSSMLNAPNALAGSRKTSIFDPTGHSIMQQLVRPTRRKSTMVTGANSVLLPDASRLLVGGAASDEPQDWDLAANRTTLQLAREAARSGGLPRSRTELTKCVPIVGCSPTSIQASLAALKERRRCEKLLRRLQRHKRKRQKRRLRSANEGAASDGELCFDEDQGQGEDGDEELEGLEPSSFRRKSVRAIREAATVLARASHLKSLQQQHNQRRKESRQQQYRLTADDLSVSTMSLVGSPSSSLSSLDRFELDNAELFLDDNTLADLSGQQHEQEQRQQVCNNQPEAIGSKTGSQLAQEAHIRPIKSTVSRLINRLTGGERRLNAAAASTQSALDDNDPKQRMPGTDKTSPIMALKETQIEACRRLSSRATQSAGSQRRKSVSYSGGMNYLHYYYYLRRTSTDRIDDLPVGYGSQRFLGGTGGGGSSGGRLSTQEAGCSLVDSAACHLSSSASAKLTSELERRTRLHVNYSLARINIINSRGDPKQELANRMAELEQLEQHRLGQLASSRSTGALGGQASPLSEMFDFSGDSSDDVSLALSTSSSIEPLDDERQHLSEPTFNAGNTNMQSSLSSNSLRRVQVETSVQMDDAQTATNTVTFGPTIPMNHFDERTDLQSSSDSRLPANLSLMRKGSDLRNTRLESTSSADSQQQQQHLSFKDGSPMITGRIEDFNLDQSSLRLIVTSSRAANDQQVRVPEDRKQQESSHVLLATSNGEHGEDDDESQLDDFDRLCRRHTRYKYQVAQFEAQQERQRRREQRRKSATRKTMTNDDNNDNSQLVTKTTKVCKTETKSIGRNSSKLLSSLGNLVGRKHKQPEAEISSTRSLKEQERGDKSLGLRLERETSFEPQQKASILNSDGSQQQSTSTSSAFSLSSSEVSSSRSSGANIQQQRLNLAQKPFDLGFQGGNTGCNGSSEQASSRIAPRGLMISRASLSWDTLANAAHPAGSFTNYEFSSKANEFEGSKSTSLRENQSLRSMSVREQTRNKRQSQNYCKLPTRSASSRSCSQGQQTDRNQGASRNHLNKSPLARDTARTESIQSCLPQLVGYPDHSGVENTNSSVQVALVVTGCRRLGENRSPSQAPISREVLSASSSCLSQQNYGWQGRITRTEKAEGGPVEGGHELDKASEDCRQRARASSTGSRQLVVVGSGQQTRQLRVSSGGSVSNCRQAGNNRGDERASKSLARSVAQQSGSGTADSSMPFDAEPEVRRGESKWRQRAAGLRAERGEDEEEFEDEQEVCSRSEELSLIAKSSFVCVLVGLRQSGKRTIVKCFIKLLNEFKLAADEYKKQKILSKLIDCKQRLEELTERQNEALQLQCELGNDFGNRRTSNLMSARKHSRNWSPSETVHKLLNVPVAAAKRRLNSFSAYGSHSMHLRSSSSTQNNNNSGGDNGTEMQLDAGGYLRHTRRHNSMGPPRLFVTHLNGERDSISSPSSIRASRETNLNQSGQVSESNLDHLDMRQHNRKPAVEHGQSTGSISSFSAKPTPSGFGKSEESLSIHLHPLGHDKQPDKSLKESDDQSEDDRNDDDEPSSNRANDSEQSDKDQSQDHDEDHSGETRLVVPEVSTCLMSSSATSGEVRKRPEVRKFGSICCQRASPSSQPVINLRELNKRRIRIRFKTRRQLSEAYFPPAANAGAVKGQHQEEHGARVQRPLPDSFIVVYSVNDRLSFDYATTLISQIRSLSDEKETPVILVANKIDLERAKVVKSEEGRSLASRNACKFIEISCTIGFNLDNLLVGLRTQLILKHHLQLNAILKYGKYIRSIPKTGNQEAQYEQQEKRAHRRNIITRLYKRYLSDSGQNTTKACQKAYDCDNFSKL